MIAFKLVLLFFLFLIGNSIVGMALLALCRRTASKNDTKTHGYAQYLLAGTGCLFLFFAVLTFGVIYRGAGFYVLSKLFAIGYFGILVCSLVILVAVKSFRIHVFKEVSKLKSKRFWKEQYLWFILFGVIGVTFFMHRPYLESRFDLPERMNTLEAVDTFWGMNPLTGESAQAPSRLHQWTRGVMPAWYLFFAHMSGVPTYRILFQVVPLWTLSLCMSAYYVIAQNFFCENKKNVRWFMVFFVLFTLCGNGAYMNPSYGLLHYGYEESTLLSNVVIPCIFALVLSFVKKVAARKIH